MIEFHKDRKNIKEKKIYRKYQKERDLPLATHHSSPYASSLSLQLAFIDSHCHHPLQKLECGTLD